MYSKSQKSCRKSFHRSSRTVSAELLSLAIIPSNVVHEALAAEDTEDIDIFSPPRMDWITGKDAYLRDAVNRKE